MLLLLHLEFISSSSSAIRSSVSESEAAAAAADHPIEADEKRSRDRLPPAVTSSSLGDHLNVFGCALERDNRAEFLAKALQFPAGTTDLAKDSYRPSIRFGVVASYNRRDSNFYIQMARRFRKYPKASSGFVSSIHTVESGIRRGFRMDGKGWIRSLGLRRYPSVLPDLDLEKTRHPRRIFDPYAATNESVFPDLVPGSRLIVPARSQSVVSLQDIENGNADDGDTAPPSTLQGLDDNCSSSSSCSQLDPSPPYNAADGDGKTQMLGCGGNIFRRRMTGDEECRLSPDDGSTHATNDSNVNTSLHPALLILDAPQQKE